MEKLSKSLEDYLEALVALGGTTEHSIRPSDIARHLGVSPQHLCRVFRQAEGMPLMSYVNRAKLQYAKELLAYTDMSLMEITNELNFESTSHFHNLFKKHFNITPAEFRKSNKSLSENKSSNE